MMIVLHLVFESIWSLTNLISSSLHAYLTWLLFCIANWVDDCIILRHKWTWVLLLFEIPFLLIVIIENSSVGNRLADTTLFLVEIAMTRHIRRLSYIVIVCSVHWRVYDVRRLISCSWWCMLKVLWNWHGSLLFRALMHPCWNRARNSLPITIFAILLLFICTN